MLANMIKKGFDLAKHYNYFKSPLSINFYEANLIPFAATQSAHDLLKYKARFIFNVNFASVVNGTYIAHFKNGWFSWEKFEHEPWLQDEVITDFQSLTVGDAVKLLLEKKPNAMITFATLRKPLYPGVTVPSYFMGTTSGVTYKIDFNKNVTPLE